MGKLKDIKLEGIIYQKVLSKIISQHQWWSLLWPTHHIQRYEEKRKLTTGQCEDCTIRCWLDYECIKNHYKLIPADLIRQKESDADPKAIQQVQLVWQLKYVGGENAGSTQSTFVLTIAVKNKEARLKFSQGSITVL